MSGDWRRVSCHGNRIFIAVGVFPVELLVSQVSIKGEKFDHSATLRYLRKHKFRNLMSKTLGLLLFCTMNPESTATNSDPPETNDEKASTPSNLLERC